MTNYIQINKELYDELQEWVESDEFKRFCSSVKKPLYMEELELESYPVQHVTYYYADANLFKAWFPIRTERSKEND